MKLEFNENKEYSIEELEQLESDFWDIHCAINDKISEVRIKDFDFTNKYIYSEEFGYMFVTYQTINEKSIYGDSSMFFQGLTFNANLENYKNNTWFTFESIKELYIPIDSFINQVRSGSFKEVSKEEFIKVLKQSTKNLEEEIINLINYTETSNEKSNN